MAKAVDAILTINFINKLFPFFSLVFSTRNIEHVLHVYYVHVYSLRSKGSRTKQMKFRPREGVFRIREGGRWGRGKKVTLARTPPDFEKPVRP